MEHANMQFYTIISNNPQQSWKVSFDSDRWCYLGVMNNKPLLYMGKQEETGSMVSL